MKIYLLYALVIGLVAAHEVCHKECGPNKQLCFKPPRPGPPPAEEDRHACPPGRCQPKFVKIDGKECPVSCQQFRCPEGMKKCRFPREDRPKKGDGCPLMPLPPICASKRKDCPTKEELADCPKQPECAKTEKLCFAPPPPPPAGEAPPKCPPVGKCAPKDMTITEGDETKTCPAPCPCPDGLVKCEAPENAQKLEDGCPLPLPPKCVKDPADCPEA